jgi:hypothetical protein
MALVPRKLRDRSGGIWPTWLAILVILAASIGSWALLIFIALGVCELVESS